MAQRTIQSEERLRAIELLLLWEGRVSRARLLQLFDVHETLASRDIAAFRLRYPHACVPVPNAKAYDRARRMRPDLTVGLFSEYERLIGATADAHLLAGVPSSLVGVDGTRISYSDHARIHAAIRSGGVVGITYRSMSQPAAHRRTIRPHTLIKAGPRLHVRAWCTKASQFRDFNLGRITEVETVDVQDLPGKDEDVQWATKVAVRLIAHPQLSSAQREMVREEYMQGTAGLRFEVEVPLVPYVIQAYRAGLDPQRHPAPDYLLMVDDPESLPKGASWH